MLILSDGHLLIRDLSRQKIYVLSKSHSMEFIHMSEPELISFGKKMNLKYRNSPPYPNIAFERFFKSDVLKQVVSEFPNLGKTQGDLHYSNPNEEKYALNNVQRFGKTTRALISFLNSQTFLIFLQKLSGIKETLIPDPYFQGGGFHEIKPGGFLKIHVDFHKHKMMNLDRRLNVLVYLNEEWEEKYGGHFELWEKDRSRCVTKISPIFNKLVVFSTTDNSWHGHPTPLTCPENRTRKSLALYYYTAGRDETEISEINKRRITTTFHSREEDSYKMKYYNRLVNMANSWLPPAIVAMIKENKKG